MNSRRQEPVFIVGSPRSGTTLLAGLLSTHSGMICGPETEFFTCFGPADCRDRLCRAASWPEAAADFLFSLVHDRPIPEYYGIPREEIIAFLKRRERSPRAILESLTETYMERHGKRRWIEKTPTHLAYVREIRRCYPKAPIIRIIRDPRDVALSMLKVPWAPASFAAAVLHWQDFNARAQRFFQSDRNSLTIRFEALLLDPEAELRKICQLIGEEFEPGMLASSRSNTHVNPTQISWKAKAGEKLDPGRTAVWRHETTPEQQCQAEAIVGDLLKAFDFPTSCEFGRYVEILNLGVLGHFPALLDHLLDGDTRFWRAHPHEMPRLRIFLGDPCLDGWIGIRRLYRLANVLRVGGCAVGAMATGVPLIWLGAHPDEEIRTWRPLPRAIAGLLRRRPDLDAFCAGRVEPIAQYRNT